MCRSKATPTIHSFTHIYAENKSKMPPRAGLVIDMHVPPRHLTCTPIRVRCRINAEQSGPKVTSASHPQRVEEALRKHGACSRPSHMLLASSNKAQKKLCLGQGQTAHIWLRTQGRRRNFLQVRLCTDLHDDKLGRKQNRRRGDVRCEL